MKISSLMLTRSSEMAKLYMSGSQALRKKEKMASPCRPFRRSQRQTFNQAMGARLGLQCVSVTIPSSSCMQQPNPRFILHSLVPYCAHLRRKLCQEAVPSGFLTRWNLMSKLSRDFRKPVAERECYGVKILCAVARQAFFSFEGYVLRNSRCLL